MYIGQTLVHCQNIPHCCPQLEFGPYFNSNVADRSPKPATDNRSGKPLPHQLGHEPLNPTIVQLMANQFLLFLFF